MAKSRTDSPIVCWDSCVFISWLDGGTGRTADEMAGLNAIASEIAKENLQLITSTLTKVEVLYVGSGRVPEYATGSDGRLEKFVQILARRNSRAAMVDNPVAEKAAEIRTECRRHGGPKLTAEDAVQIATAVVYKASVLHTFDEKLLGLSGDAGGYPLKIEKPQSDQGTLDLTLPRGGGETMSQKKPKKKTSKRLSLYSVDPEEALKAALNTPPPNDEKPKKKPKK